MWFRARRVDLKAFEDGMGLTGEVWAVRPVWKKRSSSVLPMSDEMREGELDKEVVSGHAPAGKRHAKQMTILSECEMTISTDRD